MRWTSFLAVIVISISSALAQSDMAGHDHMNMQGHDMTMGSHDDSDHMMMNGALGEYSMTQEASGTSWQPVSTPMEGVHWNCDDWMIMAHGQATAAFTHGSGDRGNDKFFGTNMFMLMASRPLGFGTLGLRSMLSLEPATIGKRGYPELFQTGETGDGRTPLVDRQHPHDVFMELAATYSMPLNNGDSAFIYGGLPGEPALGPVTFMHRFSGMDNPEAPITHHWLDSTHVTFGVLTAGYIWNKIVKVDGSIFTGREPDQNRWDFERPRMDSQSIRVTVNPTDDLSMQISYGHINSPEQLTPDMDQNRTTASITYNMPFGHSNWQTTAAWGRDDNEPGRTLDAFLIESGLNFNHVHTVFARIERVRKDELFITPAFVTPPAFWVNKFSLGYIYDFPETHHVQFGLGAVGSVHFISHVLEPVYGTNPTSFLIFGRIKL